jgi:RNA polymerase sigma-70 factor (sigma-E family)
MRTEPEGFQDFVAARSHALLRTAWMLTGDAGAAEDLLQIALARTWPHWNRVRHGQPEAYVRTVMVRTNASWRARLWNRERPSTDLAAAAEQNRAGSAAVPDRNGQIDDRALLMEALAQLPLRQRQAVVLRYFEDLSVEAVAQVMGSSRGTVKSQTAKGLAKLRAIIGEDSLAEEEL